ncbi:bifunctional cytochrome P450/NADPH--P450 reductase [Paenibacillus xylanivorans]|uniref:Bifunctional cytochrome P450/NADPH--P450 reductase n=1 Tax=Paenibacillus xylanivorans TaxID=1705561 RepID=A0A0M9BMV2_9BACL|nr:bifunctional cytochrome P450/NADPH--P450 reductase [Paenibacillus xylanivorans]KOY15189.1 NADPH--cytochrome reductase [Paenibacillus xylanivorans]
MRNATNVPQPQMYGPLGNLPLIDKEKPTLSLGELAEEYGPIYRLTVPGYSGLIVSGPDLVAELCDVSRFDKFVYNELENVRAFGGDGLFTSRTFEPNWKKAHNILLPTFSKQAMKGYHPMMVDIAEQLINKWARLNSNDSIDVADDMTRLTLDTIGLCGFNYRFNSFYRQDHSPFIESMVRALNEAMQKSSRLKIQNLLMVKTKRQFQDDIQTMFSLVDQIIEERKASAAPEEVDLLARMLNGKDPETGETLDDENIRYQIITFLIAGHETTSGLLSFALYFLLNNPESLQKAYDEVDQVLVGDSPQYEEILRLPYIRMILSESLRLWPTAPGFDVYAKEDTVIGGKYPLKKGESCSILLPQLHRDKGAWGEDAELFRPERFEDTTQVPHHAYKPFGNGERACIGMQFALYEATLVLGMVLKHFELVDYSNYKLDVKQTLTLKPGDFRIQVRVRTVSPKLSTPVVPAYEQLNQPIHTNVADHSPIAESMTTSVNANPPLLILYGSNLGTAEDIARAVGEKARSYGILSKAATLNEWVGRLPKEGIVLIVTASYNGKPPQNATAFMEWLKEAESEKVHGVTYAVLGCGDRSWSGTYQSIPRWVDEKFASLGGNRLLPRGEVDAGGDMEKQVEEWQRMLWPQMLNALGISEESMEHSSRSTLQMEFVREKADLPLARTYNASYATIVSNEELQALDSGRSTRHIEMLLPEGMTYKEGDHLGVLPRNANEIVNRILHRFGLKGDVQIQLTSNVTQLTHLPLNRPVHVNELLRTCVELQAPVTRTQLQELANYTVCPPHKRELEAMLEENNYTEQILENRITMLELLEKYEACELPFERFLELLPPLKPRYYSISSSPHLNSKQASITVSVVREPAWSGIGEFRGVASSYLADCQTGESILMFVRTPESGFELSEGPNVPIIMVGPGTGVAPFRGFLQARSVVKQRGLPLSEAHLFFGCRNDSDFIYRQELEQYEEAGIVKLHTAFSRVEGKPKTYVQHLMLKEAEQLLHLLDANGRIYVCGDGNQMAPAVEETLRQAYENVKGATIQEAKDWLRQLQAEGRYVQDVWAGKRTVESAKVLFAETR